VEIAAEHAEGQRVAAGQDVEEGLFLDRVAGERPDISARGEEDAVGVKAYATDAVSAGLDEATVSAGEAADVFSIGFDKLGRGGSAEAVQRLLQPSEALLLSEDIE
jgi:hypothetical protein